MQEKNYKLPVLITQQRYTIDSYILQIEKEIALMSAKVMTMLDEIHLALTGFTQNSIEKISKEVFEQENYIDQMNEAISDFLMNCYHMNDVSKMNQEKISQLFLVLFLLLKAFLHMFFQHKYFHPHHQQQYYKNH